MLLVGRVAYAPLPMLLVGRVVYAPLPMLLVGRVPDASLPMLLVGKVTGAPLPVLLVGSSTSQGRGNDHYKGSLVQGGIYALEKAHTHSIPSPRSFPNVAFETVPIFV